MGIIEFSEHDCQFLNSKHEFGPSKAIYRLDLSTKPPSLDLVDKGHVVRGIVMQEGDTLMLSMAPEAGERPVDFIPRDGTMVFVLRRQGSSMGSELQSEPRPANDEVTLSRVKLDCTSIQTALQAYQLAHGEYPPTLQTLTQPDSETGKAVFVDENLKDPWGQYYVYNPRDIDPNGVPYVYSQRLGKSFRRGGQVATSAERH